ncbi:MAG TPA: TIGR03857 family LLM class F420-dependent oxidoreductase [Nevskiaceae bacterium]|nr:TIGR03857 family LLM class F420-dependent oxidoreductase [Nevskiaceae bacterium]
MTALPPVVDDFSSFIIAGRVKSRPSPDSETAARTPAQGVQDGIDAEGLGCRRIFLSERWNMKEASVILSAIGARTSRVELGTGLITPASRHPMHTAAFGATMHALHGPRFVLGLGRGDNGVLQGTGLRAYGFQAFTDYVDILRKLWRGERVTYDGPAGRFAGIALGDLPEGPPPKVWFGTFGLPLAAKAAAKAFDGVLLIPNMTPQATAESVQRLRNACEEIGRDPKSLHVAQCVITAPELSEVETRQLAHARAVTYLQAPGYGDALVKLNHWDPAAHRRLLEHRQFKEGGHIADALFHRAELMEPAKLVPDEWMTESCALGSVDQCVKQLQRFRDAGADEVVTYGSTPMQNAKLIRAWATRKSPRSHP